MTPVRLVRRDLMGDRGRLTLVPITQKKAKEFIALHHRHHKPSLGAVFCLAVAQGERLCGVAMVGRPVARGNADGLTLEVTRVATDGTKNACSVLYGAAWRVAKALGYHRVITYTLASEQGTSLVASSWRRVGDVRGRSWHTPSRPRTDGHPLQDKVRWEAGRGGA